MHRDIDGEVTDRLTAALAGLLPKVEVDEETPRRMARALADMTRGHGLDPKRHLKKTFDVQHQELVVVRDIPFSSLCEHHVLPFTGFVSVGYVPSTRIVGLSKIPRMVRDYAQRLQVQERLTSQVADAMGDLDPAGVIVHVRGEHSCMKLRGVMSQGEMVTSAVRGVFAREPEARAEALALMGVTR